VGCDKPTAAYSEEKLIKKVPLAGGDGGVKYPRTSEKYASHFESTSYGGTNVGYILGKFECASFEDMCEILTDPVRGLETYL